MEDIAYAIALLDEKIPNPSLGLPDELFYFISRTTPLVNVDLLIKDENGRTLLSWRDDRHSGKGWHVPGGIIRFREKLETRIKKVAETELSVSDISFEPKPLAVNEVIASDLKIRGHFISFLYRCFLPSSFSPKNEGLSAGDRGYVMWHDGCPESLLKFHEIYRRYI